MNSMIHPAFRRALFITGTCALLCGTSPAVTVPVITAPNNGANASDFIVNGPTETALAAGKSSTFTVTFKPKAKGVRWSALALANTAALNRPIAKAVC